MDCKDLSDQELVSGMESCSLPGELFHHADHIRLAWIYLRMMPEPKAAERMASTLKNFSAFNGKPERYHHTMTLAWIRVVAAARFATPEPGVFEEFFAAHPHLADQHLLLHHYSQRRMDDPRARSEWVEPDLCPLP
ncbi:MAG TPA: hypothetical protein VLV89_07065 [Candidatus Acidoferrum sp.]|nr:hypothetical protein [Candidatus Acidoferrum sp.]